MQISTAVYSHIVSNSHELCSDCAGHQCFPGQDSSLVLHLCGRRLDKPAQVIRWRYSTGDVRWCEVFGLGSWWKLFVLMFLVDFRIMYSVCVIYCNVFPISRMCDAPDIIWTPLNANSVAGVACFSVIWVVVCSRDMSQCFWHIWHIWHCLAWFYYTALSIGQARSDPPSHSSSRFFAKTCLALQQCAHRTSKMVQMLFQTAEHSLQAAR